jgi:hypothetical protein
MDRREDLKRPFAGAPAELFTFRLLTEQGPIAYDYSFQLPPAA